MSIDRTQINSSADTRAVVNPTERFEAAKKEALHKGQTSFEIAKPAVAAALGDPADAPAAQFAAGPGRWTAMLRNS